MQNVSDKNESALWTQIAPLLDAAMARLNETDRHALIRGLFESRRATLRPLLLAAINAGADLPFEPRLRLFMHELLAVYESHRSFLKVAIENEHVRPPGSTTAQDLLGGVVGIIAAGVREGAIAAGKAELLPLVITGALKAIIVARLQAGGELASDADALVAILLDGVRRAAP